MFAYREILRIVESSVSEAANNIETCKILASALYLVTYTDVSGCVIATITVRRSVVIA
jgi:hypothetical protein